jgi:hypothetical protein
MQTPMVVFHVWPAVLHSVGDLYIRSGRSVGEAPGDGDWWRAHPEMIPKRIRAAAMDFIGVPSARERSASPAPLTRPRERNASTRAERDW